MPGGVTYTQMPGLCAGCPGGNSWMLGRCANDLEIKMDPWTKEIANI